MWGSDRRYLTGKQLARLFEEFSSGPTFVPLRSPANRYEGPSVSALPHVRPKALLIDWKVPRPQRQVYDRSDSEPVNSSHEHGSNSSAASTKAPTPSSSRPPPPHPILKKSRGPSSSGPRPTTRFVDGARPGAEDVSDGNNAGEMPPPPLTRNVVPQPESHAPSTPKSTKMAPPTVAPGPAAKPPTMNEMPPPPLPSKVKRDKPANSPGTTSTAKADKATTPTRKVVVSTAAKRRPVIPRRASSQSSAGSDREALSALAAAARQKAAAKALKPRRSSSQESGASSSSQTSQSSGLTMKALGKRPAKSPPRKQDAPGTVDTPQAGRQERPVVVQQQRAAEAAEPLPQRRSTWDIRDTVAVRESALRRNAESRRPPPPVAGFVADASGGAKPPTMMRSRSNMEGQGLVAPAVARIPPALLATTVVGTTNATAQGLFDSENITPTSTIPEARDIPDNIMLPSRPSASALLDMQFSPTPPNPAAPIPFARSKSQLTVLLEREKARKGEGF